MTLTTRKIDRRPSKETFYLIEREGVPVGFLTKYPNTRTEEHPTKLFLYDGPFVPGKTESTMVTVDYGRRFSDSKKILLGIAAKELENRG